MHFPKIIHKDEMFTHRQEWVLVGYTIRVQDSTDVKDCPFRIDISVREAAPENVREEEEKVLAAYTERFDGHWVYVHWYDCSDWLESAVIADNTEIPEEWR
jgi:hypothetical protein